MGLRVLIADDTKFMRMTLRNLLEKNGYEVVGEAEDGEQAVMMYDSFKPDIVTLDITMPNLDGIGAAKKIKEQYPTAKIVMVSAMGQKKLVTEAIAAGARHFIVKPFKPENILETLDKVASSVV